MSWTALCLPWFIMPVLCRLPSPFVPTSRPMLEQPPKTPGCMIVLTSLGLITSLAMPRGQLGFALRVRLIVPHLIPGQDGGNVVAPAARKRQIHERLNPFPRRSALGQNTNDILVRYQ